MKTEDRTVIREHKNQHGLSKTELSWSRLSGFGPQPRVYKTKVIKYLYVCVCVYDPSFSETTWVHVLWPTLLYSNF